MSEDALIRYVNLEALVRARKWGPRELADATGRSYSQCNDMLHRKKSFGEKIARSFEEALGLPRGWFDTPHDPTEAMPPASPRSANVLPMPSRTSTGETPANYSLDPDKPYTAFMGGNVTSRKRAPVVAWARLGEDLYKANDLWPASETVPFDTQKTHSDSCKFVPVNDDSLSPRILQNDKLLIDPHQTSPRIEQVGLFRLADGSLTLLRYRPTIDGFEGYNERGLVLDSKKHGLKCVGVAVLMLREEA